MYVRCSDSSTYSAHNGVIKVHPFLVGTMVTDGGVMFAVVCHNRFERVHTGFGIVSKHTVKHLCKGTGGIEGEGRMVREPVHADGKQLSQYGTAVLTSERVSLSPILSTTFLMRST